MMADAFCILSLNPLFPCIQNVLSEIPKLKHIIYVDQKMLSTDGYPAGLALHSMRAVRELGARPENSE